MIEIKLPGCSKSSSERKACKNKYIYKEIRKISNKQPNFIPQGTKNKKQIQPKVRKRKEIINIKMEINEIETHKIIERINKIRTGF